MLTSRYAFFLQSQAIQLKVVIPICQKISHSNNYIFQNVKIHPSQAVRFTMQSYTEVYISKPIEVNGVTLFRGSVLISSPKQRPSQASQPDTLGR